MRQVALLIFAVACKQGSGDDFAVLPPDPVPPPNPAADAAIGDGGVDAAAIDAEVGISGRVCLISDPRAQSTCKATGAGGFVVTIDTKTATTADDGSFVIAMPTGTDLLWQVSSTKLETSVMPFGTVNQIPAMLLDDYVNLEGDNGAEVQDITSGEVFVSVVHAGAPLANAKAGASPQAAYGPFYDSSSAIAWNSGPTDGTGAAGIAWFAGIEQGAATLSVTPMSGTLIPVPNVPVVASAITWIVVDVP